MLPDPASLRILSYPAPVLKRRASEVETIDGYVRDVAHRMLELMREAEGVGLAAPQVGLSWRLFVANSGSDGEPDRVYINPRIEFLPSEMVWREEGCLSLPGIRAQIRRPERVTITATDLDGKTFTLTSDGLLARVWQHEFDHLDGTLILDRMSPIDRLATRRAVKELVASGGD